MAKVGGSEMAASERCMNDKCGRTEPGKEWRKGWALRSGGFARLCYECGTGFENAYFCDLFHTKDSGWRQCSFCLKHVHCGCIASKSLVDLLDHGGVQCVTCMKSSRAFSGINQVIQDVPPQPTQKVLSHPAGCLKDKKLNDQIATLASISRNLQSASDANMEDDTANSDKVAYFGKSSKVGKQDNVLLAPAEGIRRFHTQCNREQVAYNIREAGNMGFLNAHQQPIGPYHTFQQIERRDTVMNSISCKSIGEACPTNGLGTSRFVAVIEASPSGGFPSNFQSLTGVAAEEKEQDQGIHNLLPMTSKADQAFTSEASKDVLSLTRLGRPPAEGRGRNQLLPRYWPRITDQELRQISGGSNSIVVPLFEKVLSASDAGRIGRLVLPKACAEAYFPPISLPEGLPIAILDSNGKEWHFQFRYWPNNNSRMYVLEGVTACIQSLQLQAGDTVTFSRRDPEGKLILGFRKAILPSQDPLISPIVNAALCHEALSSHANENISIVSGCSGILKSVRGTEDPSLSSLSEHVDSTPGDLSCHGTDKYGGGPSDVFLVQPFQVPEKKRGRNIGTKSKRLQIDDEDAMELKLTWEEAQDLLRPPPSAKPSIVMIEDFEFEEYEEPPVLGKRTMFTVRESGAQDQWTQCDECLKWRQLPVDILLPSKWICPNNTWDPKRSSCTEPSELSVDELKILLQQNTDAKRHRIFPSPKQVPPEEPEASGLGALAAAAAIEDAGNPATAIAATTTRHPRHRAGCTCIVCIQPPSGKGPKHEPDCTCNVCNTVKRRFRTLMLRKKQRQSELEEAEAQKRLLWGSKEDAEADNSLQSVLPQLDLNCHPGGTDDIRFGATAASMSMMSLLQVASQPLETYLQHNKLTSLVADQQASPTLFTASQAPSECEGIVPIESSSTPVIQKQDGQGGG